MFDIYFQIAVYIKACVYIYVTCTIENRLTTNKISILDPTCFVTAFIRSFIFDVYFQIDIYF